MERVFGTRPEYILSYSPFEANDRHLLEYYENEVPYHLIDKKSFTPTEGVDVINTVCPCAGLSTLSPSAGSDNVANDWMVNTAEYVLSELRPRVFWGENAPGLATRVGRPVVDKLRAAAERNGYKMSIYRTQSRLHGLCQVRNRAFYFFWRTDRGVPVFPRFSRPQVSFEDTVRSSAVNSPDPMSEQLSNDSVPTENPFYRYILEDIHDGMSHSDFIRQLKASTGVHEYIEGKGRSYSQVAEWMDREGYSKEAAKCRRMDSKLKSGGNIMRKNTEFGVGEIGAFVGHKLTHIVHPDQDRYLNIRECLGMMGMPRDFQLIGGRKNINHIAQNVPVTTAADMAECVRAYLNDEIESYIHTEFLTQDNMSGKLDYQSSTSLEEFFV